MNDAEEIFPHRWKEEKCGKKMKKKYPTILSETKYSTGRTNINARDNTK